MSNRIEKTNDLADGSFNLPLCFYIKRISIKKSLEKKKRKTNLGGKYTDRIMAKHKE